MSLTIVTGYTGAAHVTADDDAALNSGIIGSDDYVLKNGNRLSAAIINVNTVRISDGDLIIQGRLARLAQGTTEDMTIVNGTVGQKRNDLIIARYSKTDDIESIVLAVLKGTDHPTTPIDPAVATGVLRTGSILHEMPLYRVPVNGLVVGAVVQLFSEARTLGEAAETTYGGVGNLKWVKHPNGLIEQWGSVGITSTEAGVIDEILTLPIDFTVSNAFFAEAYIHAEWNEEFVHVRQYSASQIRIVVQNGLTPSAMYDVRYYCKGY